MQGIFWRDGVIRLLRPLDDAVPARCVGETPCTSTIVGLTSPCPGMVFPRCVRCQLVMPAGSHAAQRVTPVTSTGQDPGLSLVQVNCTVVVLMGVGGEVLVGLRVGR